MSAPIVIRQLGLQPYKPIWQAMQTLTQQRKKHADGGQNEIWLLQHPPTYTLGLAGKAHHLLHNPQNYPVIHCDRGGQITYHGPGQCIMYPLINIQQLQLSVRQWVSLLENTVLDTLKELNISGYADPQRPGIYVNKQKIAALGLRLKHGCSYHGIAVNVAMDLLPFNDINPCGYDQLKVTQLANYKADITTSTYMTALLNHFLKRCKLHQQPQFVTQDLYDSTKTSITQ